MNDQIQVWVSLTLDPETPASLPAIRFDADKLKNLWIACNRDCLVEWGGKTLELKANQSLAWEAENPADFLQPGDRVEGMTIQQTEGETGGQFVLRYVLGV